MNLDGMIRKFKEYVLGNGSYDELDFKEDLWKFIVLCGAKLYVPGNIVHEYMVLERVRKMGKNTIFRVQCLWCGGVMFRRSNKFKLKHLDCPNWKGNKTK